MTISNTWNYKVCDMLSVYLYSMRFEVALSRMNFVQDIDTAETSQTLKRSSITMRLDLVRKLISFLKVEKIIVPVA